MAHIKIRGVTPSDRPLSAPSPGPPLLRWGILGTARIARKNWKAIADSGNGTVTVVASRDLERSRSFIAECQVETPLPTLPRAVGRYEDLLAAPDVDAVYLPLPTGVRKEWVLRAAAAGKHIVCEKPCAATVEDLEEMLAACRRHGVQFMDGVMFQHSRRLGQMRAVLDDGRSVGPIRAASSLDFSFAAPEAFFRDNIRASSVLEPLGCLGDLGWYCIRISLWAMRWRLPQAASGCLLSQRRGSRFARRSSGRNFLRRTHFEDGASAGFYCSFLAQSQDWAVISGLYGALRVNDFTLPRAGADAGLGRVDGVDNWGGFQVSTKGSVRCYPAPEGNGGSQEARLFRNFADLVRSGRRDQFWPEVALNTQRVTNACLQSTREGGRAIPCS